MNSSNPVAPLLHNDDGTPATLLDVTGEICPMTFVRTRIALDKLSPGSMLAVLTRGEEASRNVPASAAALGHEIIAADHPGPGLTRIFIRRR